MTKGKYLVALLVGSWTCGFFGADQSPAQSFSGLKYGLQVLPNLGGNSNPLSINNRDWVAGNVETPGDPVDQPGLWRRTGNQPWQLTDLGTLGGPNANVSSPQKNEIGWLTGGSSIAALDPHNEDFCGVNVPDGHLCRGFLWQDKTNTMIALPPLPGGANSKATASNNSGQIAGVSEYGAECKDCTGPQVFPYEGVVWKLNASGQPFIAMTLPPLPGDKVSVALGINDAGTAVGASGGIISSPNSLFSPLQAVMWEHGAPIPLGGLGGTEAAAFGINNGGQVIGVSTLAGDADVHAFIWQKDVMKDLGSLRSDDTAIFPQDINNRGEVVGLACGPSEPNPFGCDGFLWRNGVMTDLSDLLTQPTALQICCANSINDSGDIVAAAFDPNFNGGADPLAVFLEPHGGEFTAFSASIPAFSASVPETSTWAMMLLGFTGLGYAGMRRSCGAARGGRIGLT